MPIVTIPKELITKENLVAVTRKEYEEFSAWKKSVKVRLDDQWFWTPEWQSKEAEADRAIKAGEISGPFSKHKKLVFALKQK